MGFRVLRGMLKLKKPVSARFNYVNYVVSHRVLGSTVSGIVGFRCPKPRSVSGLGFRSLRAGFQGWVA